MGVGTELEAAVQPVTRGNNVVAVIPPGAAAFMAARIDPELAHLRRSGSHVELIAPDAASLDVFGPNLMDASRQGVALGPVIVAGQRKKNRTSAEWIHNWK